MSNRFETIVFTEEDCGDNLWNVIGQQLKILSDAGYVCIVKLEDIGIVVIEFQCDDPELGCAYPYWLYPKEEDTVVYKNEK